MLDPSILNSVKFVVDSEGKKAAVQVDIRLWDELLAYLEDLEDRSVIKEKLARLRQGPEKSNALSWQRARGEW